MTYLIQCISIRLLSAEGAECNGLGQRPRELKARNELTLALSTISRAFSAQTFKSISLQPLRAHVFFASLAPAAHHPRNTLLKVLQR